MKLLFGTGNQAKLSVMKNRLEKIGIELIGLSDLKAEGKNIPEVLENGNTPLENARLKALAYYEAFQIPVFSCDSGLYFDNVPDEVQPGVHVRNVNGKCLSDEEMMEYYAGLVKQYGNLIARYRNAICFVMDEKHIYESMNPSMDSPKFILTGKPHSAIRKKGFPLDSMSIDMKTNKYYYDLSADDLEQFAVEDGVLQFFEKVLNLNREIIRKETPELIIKDAIEEYLSVSKYINWNNDSIRSKADEFKQRYQDEISLIQAIYEFVRDEIKHSWDVQDKRVTKSATEVLEQGVGICWAKANLLAAMLRACGIPAGICYQRLTLGDVPETGYCIHALNAVYIKSLDRWIRLDARGNKAGVDAQFDLEQERLAFTVRNDLEEEDYRIVYANPSDKLMKVLEENTDALYIYLNCLPDSIF